MISPHANPFLHFKFWFDTAKALPNTQYPDATVLSTVGSDGYPNSRVVLLKEFNDQGFVFYTNQGSKKGQELKKSPKASLVFFWEPLHFQVRIRGDISPVSDAESDAYFASRHRISQIGAIASKQSQILESREVLTQAVEALEKDYETIDKIPRPPIWGGYRLNPIEVEFWQERPHRLHDRLLYTKTPSGWETVWLYP
jgi:pyridoxamine 5'-phosphate oxidase